MENKSNMPAYSEPNSRPRTYWKPKGGTFVAWDKEKQEEIPANRIEGDLKNIYVFDDPGNPEKRVNPGKKVIVTLADPDELNKIVFRPGTNFAWSLMSRLANVGKDCKVKVGVKPGNDPAVNFAWVKIFNEDLGDWEQVTYLDEKPKGDKEREVLVLKLVESHPANQKPEEGAGHADGQQSTTTATAGSNQSKTSGTETSSGLMEDLERLAEVA